MGSIAKLDESHVPLFWDALCHFFKARNALNEKLKIFNAKGTVAFAGFDELVDTLSQAREICHDLFREAEEGVQRPDDPGRLFDFVVSTIFHEMLHIKEYVYILNTYGEYYGDIDPDHVAFDDSLRQWVNRYTSEIYKHARTELPASFSNVANLFESCEIILKHLLPIFADTNLARIAYVNRASATRLMFGPNAILTFFNLMFEHGPCEGFARVGVQLSRSAFYAEAAKCAQHAASDFSEQPSAQKAVWLQRIKDSLVHADYSSKTKSRVVVRLGELIAAVDSTPAPSSPPAADKPEETEVSS